MKILFLDIDGVLNSCQYHIVGSYTPGQITQFISGALVINGKKEFVNDLLHGIGS